MSHHYAIFSARYAPLTGGVEGFTQNVAHELVRQGNEVVVVTSRLDDSAVRDTQPDGVRVFRLPSYGLMNGRLPISKRSRDYHALMGELDRFGIDRVLVNTRFYSHSLEGLRFARKMDVPAVVLDHGSAYLVLGNPAADAVLRVYERGITRRGKKYAAQYAGISRMSVEWLANFGIHTTSVIPNAIDAQAFRDLASKRDFRGELGVGPSQTLVVFVGRLTPEKGAVQMADAMRLLGDSYACVLAGEGFLRKDIQSRAIPNAHLVGALDHADLSALLSQGDLFCLPTRSEGFCTSLLEAGAWGLTPLMPRVGGVDEVMGDPVRFGVLLPHTDSECVAEVIRNARERGLVGQSKELAEHVRSDCSWSVTVHALERAFS